MHMKTSIAVDKQEAVLRLIEESTPQRFKAVHLPKFPGSRLDYIDDGILSGKGLRTGKSQ
jgi:hypothetical protein